MGSCRAGATTPRSRWGEISNMMKKKALCLGLLSIAWLLSSCVTTVGGESSGSSEVYAIYEEYKANGGTLSYDE